MFSHFFSQGTVTEQSLILLESTIGECCLLGELKGNYKYSVSAKRARIASRYVLVRERYFLFSVSALETTQPPRQCYRDSIPGLKLPGRDYHPHHLEL